MYWRLGALKYISKVIQMKKTAGTLTLLVYKYYFLKFIFIVEFYILLYLVMNESEKSLNSFSLFTALCNLKEEIGPRITQKIR